MYPYSCRKQVKLSLPFTDFLIDTGKRLGLLIEKVFREFRRRVRVMDSFPFEES